MELRHLRYYVAVAEAHSFAHAALRLHVSQPALSKQIRDLEAEVGVALFVRLPRGVRMTPAGEAFLEQARRTLEHAARAIDSARGAAQQRSGALEFAHGEVGAFSAQIEVLLGTFRDAHPDVQVRVTSQSDPETDEALRAARVDVGCVFVAEWPIAGFAGHRLIDCPITGVLLPAGHALAATPAVRLRDLAELTWLNSAPNRWPGFMATLENALRDRGLVPQRTQERAPGMQGANMQIAAGDAWSLVSEAIAQPYVAKGSRAIVYRPFADAPIPCWLALVWQPTPSPLVCQLVEEARRLGLVVGALNG
jgi:DNA-binding transcriptional LysR family regulator